MKKFGKALYIGLIFLFLYLPIFTLIVMSFNNNERTSGIWYGFTLRWFGEIFENHDMLEALINTLVIAVVSAVIATVVGVAASVGIMAYSRRQRALVLQLTNIPLVNAEIVTAVSLMMAFAMFGISLGMGTILFSHICFCLPYVILNVLPKLRQTGTSTYEAARDLGAGPVKAFFSVVLPDIMPGVATGFLMSFTMSVDDFVITYFTRGAGINTLSTLIYSQQKRGIRASMCALSTVIFLIVLVVLLIRYFLGNRTADKTVKQ
ncbi:MAG: ABC transporter permease [Lachnospiraceae bacterium]|nr:ABC transporter permease [Lachnospiraceae bacterium]